MSSNYQLSASPAAEKQLKALAKSLNDAHKLRLEELLALLADNPYDRTDKVKRFKIQKFENGMWSARISYSWRIEFYVDGKAVVITDAGSRENAYRP